MGRKSGRVLESEFLIIRQEAMFNIIWWCYDFNVITALFDEFLHQLAMRDMLWVSIMISDYYIC